MSAPVGMAAPGAAPVRRGHAGPPPGAPWAGGRAGRRPRALGVKASADREGCQNSFSPLRLTCPSRPTMMWSWTAMPSGLATSAISFVMRISA